MNPLYFTAGPSQLHQQYIAFHKEAMQLNLGSLNHRSEGFRKIYQETDKQLRILLNLPNSHSIYFTGSATEIWERLILNLVEQNSFHFVNGSFSQRFYEFSKMLGKNAQYTNAKHGEGFDINSIEIPNNTELICTTQNETSAGVSIPTTDLIELKKQNPNSLVCTDIVSIAPISNIDYNFVDSSFFSVQKAFGMPPGLGVWIVNDACKEKANKISKKGILMGAHQQILNFQTNYEKWETPSTPNIVAIYILGKIAASFNEIGIANIRKEITEKAKLMYHFANDSDEFSALVKNEKHRSESMIVLSCKKTSSEIIAILKHKEIHVSSGYGALKNNEIRIANFPTTTLDEMKNLLKELQKI